MKKILFALLLLPVIASAQRLQYVNTYGHQYQRVVVDSLFAPPSDTFTVPTALQGYPFIARKGTGLYLWNTSTHVWAAVSGSGSTPTWQQTLTAGSSLTQNNTISGGAGNYQLKFDSMYQFRVNSHIGTVLYFSGNKTRIASGTNTTVLMDVYGVDTSITTTANTNVTVLKKDSTSVTNRISYNSNIHSTFTPYSLVTKKYVDSTVSSISTSPSGNYGNIQLNRNGAFATPASDSLSFNSAALNVKGDVGISDGRYLKIGGSNILNYYTGSNTATFAGAYNYIFNNGGNVFMNGATTTYFNTGTGDLYLSGSGSKIGIGTASPAASSLLDVSSTTKGVLIPRMTTTQRNAISSPAIGLQIYNTTDSAFNYYRASGWTAIGGSSQWTTTGSDIYYNGGNVGIGTATPGYKFEVSGAAKISSDLVVGNSDDRVNIILNSAGGKANKIEFNEDGVGQRLKIVSENDATIQITAVQAEPLIFGTNAAERMRIDATGNVGIGTATPNSTLHTNGSFAGKYTATATGITLDATNYVVNVTATGQTITLPDAAGIEGRIYTIKLTASGSCTVATTSSQNIDASTTYSLASQYKYVTVMSDNANWIVIANN